MRCGHRDKFQNAPVRYRKTRNKKPSLAARCDSCWMKADAKQTRRRLDEQLRGDSTESVANTSLPTRKEALLVFGDGRRRQYTGRPTEIVRVRLRLRTEASGHIFKTQKDSFDKSFGKILFLAVSPFGYYCLSKTIDGWSPAYLCVSVSWLLLLFCLIYCKSFSLSGRLLLFPPRPDLTLD